MILKFLRFIFKQFGLKIIYIKNYENERKMDDILTRKYQDDIKTLVFNPDSVRAEEIRALKRMEREHERLMWFGSPILINKNKIKPIINPPETD
jgi:hypothetical protein